MSIVTDDLVENLIQPPYVNPFYGKHTTWVVPRSDLDEEETRRYWRYHKRFPNEFAGAINKLLDGEIDAEECCRRIVGLN